MLPPSPTAPSVLFTSDWLRKPEPHASIQNARTSAPWHASADAKTRTVSKAATT